VAVTESDPAGNVPYAQVATPPLNVAVLQSVVVPEVKVTVPVGVPPKVLVTVAVKVTD
jgi:hypothetical protein